MNPSAETSSSPELFSITNQSLTYGIGILGRQLLIYISLPLFTNYLSPAAFGAVAVMTAFMSFIDVISNAGLPAATYAMYNETDDRRTQRQVLGSAFTLFAGYALAIAAVVLLFAQQVSALLFNGSTAETGVVVISTVMMVAMTVIYFGYIILRIRVRPLALSLHTLAQILFQIGFSLFFVISLHLGEKGYWSGQLLGTALGAVIILWLLRHEFHFSVNRVALVGLMAYSLPLLPATLAQWALRLMDRMMISGLVGLEQVAMYEVAYKIAMLSGLLMIPLASAWPQFSFSVAKKPNAAIIYRDMVTYVTMASVLPALVAYAFSPELLRFLAPAAYAPALKMIPWLILGQVAWAIYPVLVVGLYIRKKTVHIAVTMLLAAMLNLLLMYLLIPTFGALGAAIASFLAYLVLTIVSYWVARKWYTFPLDLPSLAQILLPVTGAAVVIHLVGQVFPQGWLGLGLRAGSVILAVILLIYFNKTQALNIYQMALGKIKALPVFRLEE